MSVICIYCFELKFICSFYKIFKWDSAEFEKHLRKTSSISLVVKEITPFRFSENFHPFLFLEDILNTPKFSLFERFLVCILACSFTFLTQCTSFLIVFDRLISNQCLFRICFNLRIRWRLSTILKTSNKSVWSNAFWYVKVYSILYTFQFLRTP